MKQAELNAKREAAEESLKDIDALKALLFHYMAISVKLAAASDAKNGS